MTSELSRALTPAEVARVIVLLVGPALGAAACGIFLLEQPGVLRLVENASVEHLKVRLTWASVGTVRMALLAPALSSSSLHQFAAQQQGPHSAYTSR